MLLPTQLQAHASKVTQLEERHQSAGQRYQALHDNHAEDRTRFEEVARVERTRIQEMQASTDESHRAALEALRKQMQVHRDEHGLALQGLRSAHDTALVERSEEHQRYLEALYASHGTELSEASEVSNDAHRATIEPPHHPTVPPPHRPTASPSRRLLLRGKLEPS